MLTSCRPCTRCVDYGHVCVPQISRSGKACKPCAKSKAVCSFTGRTVLSGSVDSEAIKEAIESAVGPMIVRT